MILKAEHMATYILTVHLPNQQSVIRPSVFASYFASLRSPAVRAVFVSIPHSILRINFARVSKLHKCAVRAVQSSLHTFLAFTTIQISSTIALQENDKHLQL
jgi:hypothetical protein